MTSLHEEGSRYILLYMELSIRLLGCVNDVIAIYHTVWPTTNAVFSFKRTREITNLFYCLF